MYAIIRVVVSFTKIPFMNKAEAKEAMKAKSVIF